MQFALRALFFGANYQHYELTLTNVTATNVLKKSHISDFCSSFPVRKKTFSLMLHYITADLATKEKNRASATSEAREWRPGRWLVLQRGRKMLIIAHCTGSLGTSSTMSDDDSTAAIVAARRRRHVGSLAAWRRWRPCWPR